MATGPSPRQVIEEMGGAKAVLAGFTEFYNRMNALDAKRSQLTEEYPDKWIALHNGEVSVSSDSLEELLGEMDRLGIPRKESIVEFMETERRNLVL